MPWPCYLVEQHAQCGQLFRASGSEDWNLHWDDLRPGAMWFDEGELCVKLPSGSEWNIDRGRRINEQKGRKVLPQWTRTGDPPVVTATPSINHQGKYHGWLKGGLLTDDCEGRAFQ